MRNGFRHIFLVCLCLFAVRTASLAQTKWDSVLDRYESITAQCKALRDKAAAGEPVSQKSMTTLFGELGRLRNMLQQSSGKMSKAQRERFERIRRSYDGSVPAGEPAEPPALRQAQGPGNPAGEPRRSVGEPVEPPATTDGPVLHLARVKLEPLPAVDGRKIHRSVLRQAQDGAQNDSRVIQSEAKSETKDLPVKRINILPTLSLGDTHQVGLFLAMTRGQWGGYVSLGTNLKSQLYAYDTLSDGTTGGEERFEARGGQRIGEYSAVAGIVRNITPWMDLYVGAGYGSSTLCWNDIHGAWAKVRDYSAAGLLLDGGAVFHLGKISLLGGVSYLTARPEAGPFKPVFSIGAGIGF
ncbi:MAG: hypothetical protein J5886_07055 [Bacteroidales bacterium]|nr:hypothetical protein [Bacteroidales bacterium]